ncbi:site-specific integrase [Aerococcaceae bacterium NML190073]|nr:site-specific integrase [Aerococcaceae bacterium NML190073]
MWIEELPNGKYKYVERYTDEVTGQVKRVSITHTKRNASAIKEMTLALQEKIDKAQSKHKIAIKVITFSELIDKWYLIYAKKIKGNTIKTRKSQALAVKKALGDYRTDKINAIIINKFLLSITEKGRAHTTVQGYKGLLSSVVTFGAKYGYFAKDFSKDLHVERINLSKRNEDKYLEHDEMKQLLDKLHESRQYEIARMCKLQTLTGMRIMEMLSLDFEKHIDLEKKTILIERIYIHREKSFTTPKNGKTRTIYINDEAVEIIKEQIRCSLSKNMLYKNIHPNNTLLFKTHSGKIYYFSNINSVLKKFPINNKTITTHYFRHTFITLMIENNVPFNLIAEQVGHSNTRMIEQVYKHFSKKVKRNLQQAVDSISVNF